jgi:hypothetical protein
LKNGKSMNEFEELLVPLAINNIRYITVGGFACAFNGFVRITDDIDIIVKCDPDNITSHLKTLSGYQSGFAAELSLTDFCDEEGSIRIQESFPIDMFTRMSGYHYEDFVTSIKYFQIDFYAIPYLDKTM